MGKKDKKQRHQSKHPRRAIFGDEEEDGDSNYQAYELSHPSGEEEEEEEGEEKDQELEKDDETKGKHKNDGCPSSEIPSKFDLYQQSVQSPKGDISYLQKFFLMYVGGRLPLHLQEDFCGTALISAEWLRSDSRRTAVGLDLDEDALSWCLENNTSKIGADGYSRISLFHGNVLQPLEAKLVKFEPQDLIRNMSLEEKEAIVEKGTLGSTVPEGSTSSADGKYLKDVALPARDIICAFNFSCCCLHSRADLVLYFKQACNSLSKKGGIFVMDLYGGTSSEGKLRLQRKFSNFTYIWEQAEFDIIERKTRISLHFNFQKQQKKLRHAFSYSWRLWSLPEIKDCLEDAGFRSVHFWLRQMPDTGENRSTVGFGAGKDIKYEEVKRFEQQDAWNAYIVGVV
ncbi:hypothetical protein UlMin_012345 [Ulmus minor]